MLPAYSNETDSNISVLRWTDMLRKSLTLQQTSSPAVAERPRDALWPSLSVGPVSLAQHNERNFLLLVTSASDSPMRTIKFCLFSSVYSRRLITVSRFAVINKIHWCWHCVVRLRDTQTPPLSVITIARRSSSHRSQGQILFEIRKSQFLPLLGDPRWNIAITLGMEKLELCGYPTVKKNWRYVYSFLQNARTWRWQTDGQTDTAWWHWLRLCIASRGKKKAIKWSLILILNHTLCHVSGAFSWNTFLSWATRTHNTWKATSFAASPDQNKLCSQIETLKTLKRWAQSAL